MGKLISVVIPTYNRHSLTNRAVESCVTSYPTLVEIVVVDDCSSVPYVFPARENGSGVPVRLVRCEENGGAGLARRAGVVRAEGSVVAFLDSDDCYTEEWVDSLCEAIGPFLEEAAVPTVYVGRVAGGTSVHKLIREGIDMLPKWSRLLVTRLLVIFCNPFYTPSLALSKSLCRFSPSLRYCEDYFTFAMAVFDARAMVGLKCIACKLGREPSAGGGLTSSKKKMFWGELFVRKELLRSTNVGVFYKVLVPIGVVYQFLRSLLKLVVGVLRRMAPK